MRRALTNAWGMVRESVVGFVNDNALSHGAAIAFYATTSLAPILLIVVAIAGLAFGHEAAQLALSAQITGLMGPESASLLQTALESASGKSSGTWAAVIGIITLLVTASGVFGEMQQSLNAIWKVEAQGSSLSRLVRARAASLGLVAALGFMLLVSSERGDFGPRQRHQRTVAVRHNRPRRDQRGRFVCPDRRHVRRYLQDLA